MLFEPFRIPCGWLFVRTAAKEVAGAVSIHREWEDLRSVEWLQDGIREGRMQDRFSSEGVGRPRVWRAAVGWHLRRENTGSFQFRESRIP